MTRRNPYQSQPRRVRPVDLLVVGLTACALSGCSEQTFSKEETPSSTATPKVDMRQDEVTQIIAFGQNSWFLVITETGGGSYGYGDGGFFGASVPRGTFDLSATQALVVAASEPRDAEATKRRRSEEGWYSVGIGRRASSSAEMLDTQDAKLIRSLFEKAMTAAPPTTEMLEMLKAHPPFPG